MKKRLTIVLGLTMILAGGMMLADRLGYLAGREAPTWSLAFGAMGFFFLTLLMGSQRAWWAVWPTCILIALALLIYTTANGLLPEDMAAAWFLFLGIALPFWLLLLMRRRASRWAIIPASVLTMIALVTGVGSLVNENWAGAMIMWGIGLPFWLVYLFDRTRWWAVIPAGVLTTAGLMPLLAETWPAGPVTAVLLGGLAVTFLLVYLASGPRRERAWALWVTAVLAVLAALAPFIGQWTNLLWPLLLIVAGVVLLGWAFRHRG